MFMKSFSGWNFEGDLFRNQRHQRTSRNLDRNESPSGGNAIKFFGPSFTDFCNKLERLSFVTFSSLD
jgi:hypothetical protein